MVEPYVEERGPSWWPVSLVSKAVSCWSWEMMSALTGASGKLNSVFLQLIVGGRLSCCCMRDVICCRVVVW